MAYSPTEPTPESAKGANSSSLTERARVAYWENCLSFLCSALLMLVVGFLAPISAWDGIELSLITTSWARFLRTPGAPRLS